MRIQLSWWKKEILWAVLGLGVIVLFEAAQQYYYVLQFGLVDPANVSFFEIFRGQFFRWLFWSLFSIGLWRYVQKNPFRQDQQKRDVFRYAAVVTLIMITNLVVITLFQLMINGDGLTWEGFSSHLIFYTFQKSPIYLIAYTVLIALAHYALRSAMYSVQLQQLSKLEATNNALYQEMKKRKYTDASPMIQVKTGNRVKLVPVEAIHWIEADDYCVKIHDNNGHTHTVRTSLKALEKELPMGEFLRIHRKAIVNRLAVSAWHFSEDPKAALHCGEHLAIAQSRVREIKLQLETSALLAKV